MHILNNDLDSMPLRPSRQNHGEHAAITPDYLGRGYRRMPENVWHYIAFGTPFFDALPLFRSEQPLLPEVLDIPMLLTTYSQVPRRA